MTIDYPPVTIASTLPPSGNNKPLSYGFPYAYLHPDDMTAIRQMIREEVDKALKDIVTRIKQQEAVR